MTTRDITFNLLKAHPHHIDELSQWMFQEWGAFYPGSTLSRIKEWLDTTIQDSDLPITMLALDGPTLVGCAMLQRTELYREKGITPWLGALMVKENYKNQGIATHLHDWALSHTKSLGFKKLYLLAFDPSLCEWYTKKNWSIFKTDDTRGHPLIVMDVSLI